MRTSIDALRSLKRYLAEVLGEEWEVRLDREDGTITLPAATVALSGPTQTSGPVIETMLIQPMTIYMTPPPGSDGIEAQVQVAECEELLHEAFRVGVGEGRPLRIPLYDYDGIAVDEAGPETRVGPDYLRITDLTWVQIPDQDDTRRVSLNADLRVTWRRRGRVPGGKHDVKSVTVGITGS